MLTDNEKEFLEYRIARRMKARAIAMVVRESAGEAAKWETKIFASDLSMAVLKFASRGRYPGRKVRETVPAHLLRTMVAYDFHNLKHEYTTELRRD